MNVDNVEITIDPTCHICEKLLPEAIFISYDKSRKKVELCSRDCFEYFNNIMKSHVKKAIEDIKEKPKRN